MVFSNRVLAMEGVVFLELQDSECALKQMIKVLEKIHAGKNRCVVVIVDGCFSAADMNDTQKMLIDSIYCLPVLTLAMISGSCTGLGSEISIACDLRLIHHQARLSLPRLDESNDSGFKRRLGTALGIDGEEKAGALLGMMLDSEALLRLRLVNGILKFDDIQVELEAFLRKILNGKSEDLLASIVECFNHYKKLGLQNNRTVLLGVESRLFCRLAKLEFQKRSCI